MISRIKSELRFVSEFQCFDCKVETNGTTERLDFDGSVSALNSLLECHKLSSNYMPVGWSSFYRKTGTIFKCEKCK